jgi:dTDP-glucose pyrophosphorylase
MKDWKKVLISEATPIREAIQVIDAGALQIALVVDEGQRLLGTITDGDVRRGILKGIALEEPAARIMNTQPTVAYTEETREEILARLRQKSLHQVPVLNQAGCLVGLEILENLLRPQSRENLVVIMAGGLGRRLSPMTDDCPKPMLRVGGKPILETIIEKFLEFGFQRFCLAVNYKAEMIEGHFGDGSKYGCHIEYLHEDQPLGTAGALSLLPVRPTAPILVINGDVLTKVDYNHLLSFHYEHQAKATMCVREYGIQVPYGVVVVDEHRFVSIEEKPEHKFFINAGIYVLEPEALVMLIPGEHCDMPSLLNRVARNGQETAVFPVREYWLDLGQIEDFNRAKGEYDGVFNCER